jgi:nitrogenase-associated protein
MTTIIFYEKPGCTNNTKQKVLLAAAGHTVWAKNLLTEAWTRERLLAFFGSRPVALWFNRAAPRIKSCEIDPEKMDAENAISMMLADPLLIRRPLIEADGRYEVGFEHEVIDAWLGLDINPTLNKNPESDLELCKKVHGAKPCSSVK